ncbi:hypothetical protein [Flavobacterium sp.]|jgi:hypothetical protein|uniref:hypothetical protein n=1 Tax=Flavobacterium sp. TaxID=239 RepID=UPI0037BE45A7
MKKIIIALLALITFIQISCSSDILDNTPTANPVDVYVVGQKNSQAAYWKNNQEVLLNNGIGCEADTLMVSNGNIHVFGKKQLDNWTTQFMHWKNNVATNLTETFNTPAQFVRTITGMDVVGDDVYFVGYTKNPLITAEIYDLVYWKNGNKTVIDIATNPTFKSKIKVVNNNVYVIGNKSNCFNNCHGVFVNGVFQTVPVGVLLKDITVKDNQVYVYGTNYTTNSVYYKNLTTGTESNITSISNAFKLLFDNDNLYISDGSNIYKNNTVINSSSFFSFYKDFVVLNDNKYILKSEGDFGTTDILYINDVNSLQVFISDGKFNTITVVQN